MADNKATVEAQQATTEFSFPFLLSPEWQKSLSEAPVRLYGELFSFTAKRLRAQADFVQGLADCGNPTDLVKRQADFFQSSWKTYLDEASKIWSSTPGVATSGHLRK